MDMIRLGNRRSEGIDAIGDAQFEKRFLIVATKKNSLRCQIFEDMSAYECLNK